jgi:hypothetical protein
MPGHVNLGLDFLPCERDLRGKVEAIRRQDPCPLCLMGSCFRQAPNLSAQRPLSDRSLILGALHPIRSNHLSCTY